MKHFNLDNSGTVKHYVLTWHDHSLCSSKTAGSKVMRFTGDLENSYLDFLSKVQLNRSTRSWDIEDERFEALHSEDAQRGREPSTYESRMADANGMKFGWHAGHYHTNLPSKYEHCWMTGTGDIRVRRFGSNPALSTTSAIEASVERKSIGDNSRTPWRNPIKFTL